MERSAGLSKTALPTGPFDLMSPETMGDFVIKLAQHLGIDRMHAVGPNAGPSRYCLRRPQSGPVRV
jgi:hypothetical protein